MRRILTTLLVTLLPCLAGCVIDGDLPPEPCGPVVYEERWAYYRPPPPPRRDLYHHNDDGSRHRPPPPRETYRPRESARRPEPPRREPERASSEDRGERYRQRGRD